MRISPSPPLILLNCMPFILPLSWSTSRKKSKTTTTTTTTNNNKKQQTSTTTKTQIKTQFFPGLSDSFEISLQTSKCDHSLLVDLFNLYSTLICDKKDIIFAWVPGHVGIQGNTVVDLATRHALEKPVNKRLAVPYYNFKVLTNMYTKKLWQTEWERYPENKLYKIQPKVDDPIPSHSRCRRGETVLCRLHIGHTFYTHFYLLKGEEPPVCIQLYCLAPAHKVCGLCGVERAFS